MGTKSQHYIIILCGGTGPRLWPLSRASNPKQFLSIFGPDSFLQSTIKRAQKIIPKENIYIVSNLRYLDQIKNHTRSLICPDNIIAEPDKKNTLMAITYAAAVICQKDPEAIITSMPSDHHISSLLKFKKDIKKSGQIARNTNSLVLIGIRPTNPNPSYGYFQVQKTSHNYQNILKFIEKPDPKKAQSLINTKALWNSGIYTFSVPTFLSQLKLHQPQYFQLFNKLLENLTKPQLIQKIYKLSPNLPIDTGISEKSKNLVSVTATFDWSDVGEWRTIFEILKKDKNKIAPITKESSYLSVNSQNCLVRSTPKKIIGLVGVSNLAIIDTPDGLLVCDLNSSSNVRDLISLIVKDKLLKDYFLS